MRVAFGSDHAGFALKEILKAELERRGHEVLDLGPSSADVSVDYPDFGAAVGRAVAAGEAELGVCTCGSGIGIAMAANKIAGIRAAVVHDVTTATLARQHNHANVVCLGSRMVGGRGHRRPGCLPRRSRGARAAMTAGSPSWPSWTERARPRPAKERHEHATKPRWPPTPRWPA